MKLRDFGRLLKEASKLNIFDLAYELSSEDLNLVPMAGHWEKVNGIPRRGIAIRVGIFFWHFYKSLIFYWSRKGVDIITPAGVVFFALSKNETDSLTPVYSKIPNAYLTGGNETPFPFPFVWAYMLSIPYLPLVLIHFLKAKGYRKITFAYIFDHYWLIYGLYIVGRLWLCQVKPKALILANETLYYHSVMAKAAREQGVPTVHMQHAATIEKTPPLIHDYALLDGQDNLRKVVRAGTTQPRIFLIGIPKHDAHFQHINNQAQLRSLGICVSSLDPIPRAEELIARIRQEFVALPLILRPHPSDPRCDKWQELVRRYRMEFSDSKNELSYDFLRKVDAIIAGESNIFLEATLMNVVPLGYDYAQRSLDWYGFRRSGLVEYFSELDSMCNCLRKLSKHKPEVRIKAKFYCATIGTRYDGHSGELAAALIQSFVSGAQVDRSIWKRIPDVGLEAYELEDDLGITIGTRSL